MRWMCLLVIAAACGKNQEAPPPSSGSPTAKPESGPHTARAKDPATQAMNVYRTLCVMCHGESGRGDGPAVEQLKLDPKPRDYTDPKWQASVTDDQIKTIILKGGAGVGKSPSMPGQPSLESEPEKLAALVQLIRGFAKPAPAAP